MEASFITVVGRHDGYHNTAFSCTNMYASGLRSSPLAKFLVHPYVNVVACANGPSACVSNIQSECYGPSAQTRQPSRNQVRREYQMTLPAEEQLIRRLEARGKHLDQQREDGYSGVIIKAARQLSGTATAGHTKAAPA